MIGVKANGHNADPLAPEQWPAPLNKDALIGLAGDFVGVVAPHSEADPVALLVQFLVAVGNACGRSPHFMAEASRHGVNLFSVMVGETAKGRKGTSYSHVERLVSEADPEWIKCLASGLSSGEGLIHAVRDPVEKLEPIKDRGKVVGQEMRVVDEGVTDKRLLAYEAEFANVLTVATRDGNTLSAIIRAAWDTGNLRVLTKNSPARSTDAHISIVAHITKDELATQLTRTSAANGFGNRFLWVCVRRSKLLPEGGQPDNAALAELARHVGRVIEVAREVGLMQRDEEARALWHEVYGDLSEGQAGLLGCILGRAEAQVMRLACVYALLDLSPAIRLTHLKAALAVWRYCEDSARFIFGESLGDPIADTILIALRRAQDGLSRTEISGLFGRNQPAAAIDRAMGKLTQRGLARRAESDAASGRGRPTERWTA